MYLKEKLYLIAGNVDESIKSATSVYDVTIFKTFIDLEKYVNENPVVIDTLVLTTNELAFTSVNMARLLNVLESPFLSITSSIIYLVDKSYDMTVITKFLEDKKLSKWSVYQDSITVKFIADILSGERRDTVEGQVDIVTYRMRTEDYLREQQQKKYESDSGIYETDEDLLAGIPDEEVPVDIPIEVENEVCVSYIVGANIMERTVLTFIVAQYRALTSKTLIMEKDLAYHRLSDIVTKSGVGCLMLDVTDLLADAKRALDTIRQSTEKLVIITCYNRIEFDYNFIMDILETNLRHDVSYIVRECDFDEAPFGKPYTIMTRNTVPDLLECCNSLKYSIDTSNTVFVGVELGTLGPVNISGDEMKHIIMQVLEKPNVFTTIVSIEGILLKGEKLSYDILSVIGRAGW